MLTISELTEFMGWSSLINICLLAATTLAVILMRESIIKLHEKIFKVNAEELPRIYFQYVAQYKLAIIILNVVPYISLKIMA
ncbi:MAG: hypothetical protein KZQ83_12430 [gamma proteobacterium symbiont of Taylorina sp.]|nr:hypothetical protein [gamma proteobacterium symbiont of Taylorina sp.]